MRTSIDRNALIQKESCTINQWERKFLFESILVKEFSKP